MTPASQAQAQCLVYNIKAQILSLGAERGAACIRERNPNNSPYDIITAKERIAAIDAKLAFIEVLCAGVDLYGI